MSKNITIAKIRSDGVAVKVLDNGDESRFPDTPMRSMTEAEIEAGAAADCDARSMTASELQTARRIPRAKTLRRALNLTQQEFAAVIISPSAHYVIGNRDDQNQTSRPGLILR